MNVEIKVEQHDFTTWDDTKLIYRCWLPDEKITKLIVLLHRGHEHSGRMEAMATYFAEQGYGVYAWDARGNGLSEGPRDHAESFSVFTRDLQCFIERIQLETELTPQDMVMIASSMGAVIAASWLHDYAPQLRALILATPALKIRLYVPFAMPMLKLARRLRLMPTVTSYVKSKVLTHDRLEQEVYNQDPLISGSISTDLLLDTYNTGQRLLDDAGAITTPTLMICAGQDWVVERSPQRKFYNGLSSPWKEWAYYPDLYHAVFHEDKRHQVFDRCLDFITRAFDQPLQTTSLLNAHQTGYSKNRMDKLSLPTLNPSFAITRLAMKTLGKTSHGITLGLEKGFDSGCSLEKIYQNEAKGKTKLGRFIDRNYLNSAGWRGIRQRKQHLDQLLHKYLGQVEETSAQVVDIASGNGLYLFEMMAHFPEAKVEMRDYDTSNIEIMAEKAKTLGLAERVNTVQADAFDPDSYPIAEQYHLAVASGVFELFNDNSLISYAIQGIAKQLKPGGYFIYTNQPWHPQQELIAKTLNSHRGTPWVMRCRTQAEMDQLVSSAGLKKVEMLIDREGVFTVSVAIKP